MRALVIGGTGFVGVACCKELMRRGVETIAASRTDHPYGTFTSHVVLDRRDREQLRAVLRRTEPDVLVDLAAFQPADVVAALQEFPQGRYVFASTSVYPEPAPDRPALEDDFQPLAGEVPEGELPYFEGKRWCETVLQRQPGRRWVSLRLPALFGAGDPTLRIAAYLQRLGDGGPLLVPAETYRRPAILGWVKDAGFAAALAADPARPVDGRAYNVAFPDLSLAALLEGLGRATGQPVTTVAVPFTELPPGASPYGPNPTRPAGYDLTRSRAELGFMPSEPEDALAETLAWYRVARPSHPGYAERPRELELAASKA